MAVTHRIPLTDGAVPFAGLSNAMTEDSDEVIATQKAVKAYVDATALSVADAETASAVEDSGGIAAAYIDFNAAGEAGMTITVGDAVYTEADTADAEEGVFTNGANAAASATSLIAAINDDERAVRGYTAVADASGDGVWLFNNAVGADDTALSTEIDSKMTQQPAFAFVFGGAAEAGTTITINGVDYAEADTAVVTTGTWTNGASAADSAASLVAAINGDTRATVPFTAVASTGGDEVFISWDDAEETDEFVVTHDSAAELTTHFAKLILFSAAGTAGASVTIDGVAYTEANTADAEDGVWTNGASAADSATSLAAAIEGDIRDTVLYTAEVSAGGDDVWLYWDTADTAGTVAITAPSANCTVSPTFFGGYDAGVKENLSFSHTVTAQDLLSGAIEFPLSFVPNTLVVQAYSSTGAPVYFTDLVTVEDEPTRLRIATDGATNIAATNVIHVLASE